MKKGSAVGVVPDENVPHEGNGDESTMQAKHRQKALLHEFTLLYFTHYFTSEFRLHVRVNGENSNAFPNKNFAECHLQQRRRKN
jgi:hypothetical protein